MITMVQVEVPSTDSRRYEHVTLARNGLRCLLVEDVKAEKSAAAVAVRVGQMQDGPLPGLAHLTEHLLFMGTSKFPDENGYDKYLSAAGGHSNAYTNLEATVYYCDCQGQALEGALDRFSSCFICPLLGEGSVEREIQAVDSEHAKNVTSDHWRLDHLSRTLLGRYRSGGAVGEGSHPNCHGEDDDHNRHHPYASFGSGNRESLEAHDIASLREAVHGFWKRYYVASNMTLAVLGNDLEEMRRMVELYFSEILGELDDDDAKGKGEEWSRPSPLPPLSPPLPLRVDVVPIRDHITVELQWPMREVQTLYRSKPSRAVSHLLGHEGPGSLLSCLRDRHWAQELVADDMSKSCRDFSVFCLEVELTQAGLDNLSSVIALVFHYIGLLRDIPEWVFEELKASSDMQFRFLSDRPPSDTVSTLVDAMHHYPPELVLSGPFKLFVDKHPKQEIQEIVQCLTPSNVLVIVGAKDVGTDQVDRWYGTCYREIVVDESVLESWNHPPADMASELRLPDRNDMMPTSFDLVEPMDAFAGDPLPRCLMDTSTCRLWYKPDTVFSQPKVNIMILLRTTAAYMESPMASVLSALWVECLQEHAKDFSYAASMAGLHCDFAPSRSGIEMNVSGYSHRATTLVERILASIDTLPQFLTIDVLERIVEKTRNQFSAFLVAQPYQHAIYATDLCLEDPKWRMQDRLAALEDVTLDDLLYFASRVLKRLNVEMLVHGNVTGQQALGISEMLLKRWGPQLPLQLPALRVTRLDTPCSVHRFRGWNDQDCNSCIVNYYQVGPVATRTNAVLSVVHHLMREPAFNQLRTEEQLGYIVHTAVKTNGDNIKSWICLIQSDSFDPPHMDLRIEAFLTEFRTTLASMPVAEFASNVESVCQNLLEKNKNLGEESSKHWTVISNQTYRFQRLQEIAEEARKLTLHDVLRFFDRYVAGDSPFRRKLSVQVFGKNHVDSLAAAEKSVATSEHDTALVQDPVAFRREQTLFPLSAIASIDERRLDV